MRRWWRWTLHCRRGRRCARAVIEPASLPANVLPFGQKVVVTYACDECGTRYVGVYDATTGWTSRERFGA